MFAGVCIASLCVAGASPTFAVVPRPAPVAGEIVTVNGDESLRFVNEPDWRIAEATQDLLAGDALKTGPAGTLALRFADETMIRVHRNSELTVKAIPQGGTAELQLEAGRVWARATTGGTGVDIETPAATAAIRGTDWTLEVLPDRSTRLIVLAGVVELQNAQGSVSVGPGEAAIAAIGKAPSKIFLTQAPGREQMLYHVAARDIFSSLAPTRGLETAPSGVDARARRAEILAKPIAARSKEDWVDMAQISLAFDDRAATDQAVAEARKTGALSAQDEARLALVEGLLAGQRSDWAGAEAKFAAAIPGLTGDDQYLAEFGRYMALLLGRRPEDARRVSAKLDTYPPSPVHAMSRAWLSAMSGDLEQGLAIIEETQPRYPKNVDLALFAAQIEILLGHEAEARRWTQRAIEIDPDSPETLRVQANIASDYDWNAPAARAALTRAIAAAPGDADLYNELALVLYDDGDVDGGRNAFERAIALDPEDPLPRANYSILLVDSDKLDQADAMADQALALDPSFYIALLAKGRVNIQRGDLPAARGDFLNAVAANPLMAQSTLGLAIEQYEAGDLDQAYQSIDAAERLDPNDPIAPLVRTVIALDRAEIADAIINARKAFERYRARGGIYNPFAATQSAGSYMTAAFDTLHLTDWSRLYGDLLFSPFDAGSQFYQATAARAPVAINQTRIEFSTSQPALIQGLLLEPLSVAARNRFTDLYRRPFLDTEIGGSVGFDDDGEASWSADGNAQGFMNGPIPVAFFADYSHNEANGDTLGALDEVDSADLFFGANLTLVDRLVVWGQFANADDDIPDAALPSGTDDDAHQKTYQAGIGYSHSFGARNLMNAVVAYGNTNANVDHDLDFGFSTFDLNDLDNEDDKLFVGLSHSIDLGGVTLRYGVEGQSTDRDISQREEVILFGFPLGSAEVDNDSTPLQGNAYFDVSTTIADSLMLQGGLTVAHVENGLGVDDTRWEPHVGIAWLPTDGQWLRLAYQEIPDQGFLTSLAPVTVVGLTPGDTPTDEGGEVKSLVARWDAEWNKHIFTYLELEHQKVEDFGASLIDKLGPLSAEEGRIERISGGANVWFGNGFGAFVNASGFDSEITDGPGDGRLPLVPDWFANAGISWVHPAQITFTLSETVIGHRLGEVDGDELGTVPITNFSIEWQPWDKRLDFSLDAINLLDENFDLAEDIPAPGRTILLSGHVRF
ncbi:MAG: FecR domain-containing protein [Dongiaceae bacterium]